MNPQQNQPPAVLPEGTLVLRWKLDPMFFGQNQVLFHKNGRQGWVMEFGQPYCYISRKRKWLLMKQQPTPPRTNRPRYAGPFEEHPGHAWAS